MEPNFTKPVLTILFGNDSLDKPKKMPSRKKVYLFSKMVENAKLWSKSNLPLLWLQYLIFFKGFYKISKPSPAATKKSKLDWMHLWRIQLSLTILHPMPEGQNIYSMIYPCPIIWHRDWKQKDHFPTFTFRLIITNVYCLKKLIIK